MKTNQHLHSTRQINALGGRKLITSLMTAAACVVASTMAHAHLSYTGRDFGSYSGLSFGTATIANQAVTGNYGWADAADGVLGDSHKGRAFRFHLDNAALVNLSVSANATATATSIGGLLPGFSIYSGLAALAPFASQNPTNSIPSADHDFSDASVAWRTWWVQQNLNPLATDASPTDGSWNALGNWRIGGDGDLPGDFAQLSNFIYQGSAVDSDLNGNVSGSFLLAAGDYTVMIGGIDLGNKTSGTAASGFGLSATFTVTAVPEPTTFALLGVGAFVLSRATRRRAN